MTRDTNNITSSGRHFSADSDPSYTNSSDGIDIYDQIGGHTRATNHQLRQHNQFLDHKLAPEVHVGEWENMYDR